MDSAEKLLALTLRFLSLRPHSEKEINDFLQKKKFPEDEKTYVLSYLKKHKLIDDREFAKWFIDQRTRVKPEGKYLISLELKRKGIAEDIIKEAFRDPELAVDDAIATKLIEKKWSQYRNLPKTEIYRKLGALLSRKGFDFETVKRAIDRKIRNNEPS